MPGATPLGIRFPLVSEPPAGNSDMQRLAGDVDPLLPAGIPYACAGLDANQGPVGTTGAVFVGGWVARYTQGGMTVNTNGIVAPVAGTYEVTAWARLSCAATANNPRLIIGNGASAIIADAYGIGPLSAAYNTTLFIARVVTFAAGEQIRCGFNQGVASTITMVGGVSLTGLIAKLLRKS